MAQSIDQSASRKNLNLLLIGWPGNGKSATGNSILGHKAFHTSSNFNRPATECPQAHNSTYNGLNLTVVDGVDLAAKRDSKQSDDPIHFSTLSRAAQLCPDGFHAILFVAKYGEKYSQNEAEIVNIVQAYFGKDFVRTQSICIITHADNYAHAKDNEEFKDFTEWCFMQTPEFRQLLKTCGSRCVLFDNLTKDNNIKKQQREELVSLLSALPSMGFKGTKMPDHSPLSRSKSRSREPDYRSGAGNPMENRDSRRRQRETDDGSGRDGQTPVKFMRSDPSPAPPIADLCLLVMGASGNGRSSTGNSILGKQAFSTVENSGMHVDKGMTEVNGKRVLVVDGPGIDVDDSRNFTNMDKITKGIQQALEFCGYRFSALIITIRYGHRFTKKEMEAVKVIKAILGHDVLRRYGICVMTNGDDFNREPGDARDRGETLTFEDWCSAQTGEAMKLFQECRQRCVLFDNKTKDLRKQQHQVMKLLSLVSGKSYNMQEYSNAERGRRQLLFEAKLPELERETSQVLEKVRRQMGDVMANYFDQPVTQKQELEQLLRKLDHHTEKLRSLEFDSSVTGNLKKMVMILHGEISVKVKSIPKNTGKLDKRRRGPSERDRNDIEPTHMSGTSIEYGAMNVERLYMSGEPKAYGAAKSSRTTNEQDKHHRGATREPFTQWESNESKPQDGTRRKMAPDYRSSSKRPTLCPIQPNADLCLLLLGASGNGKSSTGNSILGKQAFSTIASTNENGGTRVDKGVSELDGKRIFVVDGPGIDVDDSRNFTNMDKITKGIQQALEFCGYIFSALIITIRFGHRFTKKEMEAVKVIKAILGHDVLSRYGICVMTYGDDFNREFEEARDQGEALTFEDWCSAQTGEAMKLFQECRQRCVLFDNKTKDPRKQQHQVKKLLSLVSGESYTMQEYANAERGREQLLFEAKLPELERETSQVLEEVRHQMGDVMAFYFDQPVTQKQELEKLLQKLDHHSEKLKSPDFNSYVIENLQRMVMVLHGEISVKLKSAQRDIDEQDARSEGTSGRDRNDSERPYKTRKQVDYGAVGSSRYSEDQIGHPTSAVTSRVPYSGRGSDDIEPLPSSPQEIPARNTEEHSQGLLGKLTCGVLGLRPKAKKYSALASQSPLLDIQDNVPGTSEKHKKKGQGCMIS